MPIIAFRLVDADAASGEVLERLAYSCKMPMNLVTHPFDKSRLAQIGFGQGDVWVLQIEPSWFRLDLYGWVLFPFAWWLGAPWWAFIPIVTMMSLSVFWSPFSYQLGLLLGLAKRKSKAKVKFLRLSEVVEVAVFGSG